MKIALIAAEAYPFSKTGGLGDVVGALFKELLKEGVDVKLFLPYYRETKSNFYDKVENTDIVYGVSIGEAKKFGALLSARAYVDEEDNLILTPDKRGNVYFLEHNYYYDREQIYGNKYGGYFDEAERFIFFSKAFLEICKILNFQFDVIHCHDWHTSLIPLYLKTIYRESSCFEKSKTILTIHNLGYQGVFPKETMNITGFGWEMFHIECLEFYGMVNFLKVGILNADVITTVSPTYAREILMPEYGFGLDGVLRKRQDRLVGILNGIDYRVWNPQTDPYIVENYSIENIKGKEKNKEYLMKMACFNYDTNTPLVAFLGRMVSQKGIDILIDSLPELVKKEGVFIFLGTGEYFYENKVSEMEHKFPLKIKAFLTFDEELAHKIYAGADGIILPSKYEPCGLSQMISMRYGTIPICRKTGGFIDTVDDLQTGFLFENYEAASLIKAMDKFFHTYRDEEKFHQMKISAMKKDFSWSKTCKNYIKLYDEAINL